MMFLIKGNGPVKPQTIMIAPNVAKSGGKPHVRIASMDKGGRVPSTEAFLDKYALKVTFGTKEANGDLPGTIYLCTPLTPTTSFVAPAPSRPNKVILVKQKGPPAPGSSRCGASHFGPRSSEARYSFTRIAQ